VENLPDRWVQIWVQLGCRGDPGKERKTQLQQRVSVVLTAFHRLPYSPCAPKFFQSVTGSHQRQGSSWLVLVQNRVQARVPIQFFTSARAPVSQRFGCRIRCSAAWLGLPMTRGRSRQPFAPFWVAPPSPAGWPAHWIAGPWPLGYCSDGWTAARLLDQPCTGVHGWREPAGLHARAFRCGPPAAKESSVLGRPVPAFGRVPPPANGHHGAPVSRCRVPAATVGQRCRQQDHQVPETTSGRVFRSTATRQGSDRKSPGALAFPGGRLPGVVPAGSSAPGVQVVAAAHRCDAYNCAGPDNPPALRGTGPLMGVTSREQRVAKRSAEQHQTGTNH